MCPYISLVIINFTVCVIIFTITLVLLKHWLVAPEILGRPEVSISPLFPVITATAAVSPSGVEICRASRSIRVLLVWAVPQALAWL
jgi:hypothetical protein